MKWYGVLILAGIMQIFVLHADAAAEEKQVQTVMEYGRTVEEKQIQRVTKDGQAVEEVEADTETELWKVAEEILSIRELDDTAAALSEGVSFSFTEVLKNLLRGELDLDVEKWISYIIQVFIGELSKLRTIMMQLLFIIFAGAVFSNFIRVFENSQIAEVGFYMIYMIASALLVRAFLIMNQITVQTCDSIRSFMQALLPSYLVTVVLSAGTVTAVGFYEITLLALQMIQVLVIKFVLPGIHFYLILLILNQIAAEDYFSRFAKFAEMLLEGTLKTVFGIVIGLQAVQCLTAPAVDSLKNSALHRLTSVIPGVGNALDAASQTVAGSAVVLKNAVGVTGMAALTVICLTPVLKLAAAILMFRLLGAMVQPICEKRLLEALDSVAKGMMLLLRVLLFSVSVWIISLAMITAALKK